MKYSLASADAATPRPILAHLALHQHRIEEAFPVAKDDLGMDHDEVRSWVGWHHPMTMSFPDHCFLIREHPRMGGKSAGAHRAPGGPPPPEAVPLTPLDPQARPRGRLPTRPQRPIALLPLQVARPHRIAHIAALAAPRPKLERQLMTRDSRTSPGGGKARGEGNVAGFGTSRRAGARGDPAGFVVPRP